MTLSFKLADEFVSKYSELPPPFGFVDAGGNSLGEITFARTYSRMKDDGTKERWWEVCRRVIEGMYSIQKDWAKQNKLPWNDWKAQSSAREAYERMFALKWTPPGRGLWVTGTEMIHERNIVAGLYNCSFTSTGDINHRDPGAIFAWVMDALMLGVGVGFDTLGAHKNIVIKYPEPSDDVYLIEDSREGWHESVRRLINSYLRQNRYVHFDYTLIRPYGEPIRGFGGTASGPGPLITLHDQLREIFNERVGETLDTRLIVDIVNLIGTCVVAGNVRRSATIALGEPGDDDFANLKNADVFPYRVGWSWMSNNTVVLGKNDKFDYESVTDLIATNGEPGFFWLDTAREYGRLIDQPDNADHRVLGLNPCVTADSYLFTESGITTFGEAFESQQPQRILSDTRITFDQVGGTNDPKNWIIDLSNTGSEFVDATHVFLTQKNADVVKVSTSNGISVRVTPDHLIATKKGMVEAGSLVAGDKILVTPAPLPASNIDEPQTLEEKEAFLIGLITGDGTFSAGKITEVVHVDLWNDDQELAEKVEKWLQEIYNENCVDVPCQSNRGFSSYNTTVKPDKTRISSSFFAAYLKSKYGFERATKHVVPDVFITNARSAAARFYVAGLAYADGTVNLYNKAGSSSVRINQSNKKLLSDVQMILLANGISSSIYKRRNAGQTLLPDGQGGSKLYDTKANYELVIMMHSYEYTQFVGFGPSKKQSIAEQTFTGPSRKKNAYTSVIEVVPDGNEDVYCLTEPKRHTLVANGLSMRQCAEISLESFETCNLVELHLNRHDSIEDYLRTIKFAYLYAKTITLLPTHWPETNAVIQRNRRIGTSQTGIAGFVDHHGIDEFRKWSDAGYHEIQRYDNVYSEWLGIRESIKTTTVKPSGSVSLLSGSTPGVHWPAGGEYYLRSIRFSNTDPLLSLFKFAGYTHEPDVMSANTTVVYFPMKTDMKRSERDVSIYEKIHLAATAQQWWADNAVSVTVTFDPETERADVARVLNMYEGQLKSVSFLPMSNDSYPQMPYTQITQEEYESYVGKLKQIDFSAIYDGVDNLEAVGESYCSNDSCVI